MADLYEYSSVIITFWPKESSSLLFLFFIFLFVEAFRLSFDRSSNFFMYILRQEMSGKKYLGKYNSKIEIKEKTSFINFPPA